MLRWKLVLLLCLLMVGTSVQAEHPTAPLLLPDNTAILLWVPDAPDARDEMKVGELAFWLPGNALCVFFGPTPASTGTEPRAASAVNPAGMLKGDVQALSKLGTTVEVAVARQ